MDQPIEEVHSLLLLNAGVNRHPHICHGGVLAAVVDEIMSLPLILNKDREAEVARKEGRVSLRVPTVTAELNITYTCLYQAGRYATHHLGNGGGYRKKADERFG